MNYTLFVFIPFLLNNINAILCGTYLFINTFSISEFYNISTPIINSSGYITNVNNLSLLLNTSLIFNVFTILLIDYKSLHLDNIKNCRYITTLSIYNILTSLLYMFYLFLISDLLNNYWYIFIIYQNIITLCSLLFTFVIPCIISDINSSKNKHKSLQVLYEPTITDSLIE